MKKTAKRTEAGQEYAAAHEAHYTTMDLAQAVGRHRAVMDAHREAQEVVYSRSQLQNIVRAVVPRQEPFDSQVELALAHVAHDSSSSIVPSPVAPTVGGAPGGTTWMAPLRITAMVLTGLWGLGAAIRAWSGSVHVLAALAVALLLVELVKTGERAAEESIR